MHDKRITRIEEHVGSHSLSSLKDPEEIKKLGCLCPKAA